MNYIAYEPCSFTDGIGCRVVVWVSGCNWGCEGCFSTSSHNPKSGEAFTEDVKNKVVKDLDRCDGLTWSGGDPLHKRNYLEVISFSEEIKEKLPEKTIWLYTGYTFEQLQSDPERSPILEVIDVLIDGKYDKNLPPSQFRGSSNQRVIDVKKTLDAGHIVEYTL